MPKIPNVSKLASSPLLKRAAALAKSEAARRAAETLLPRVAGDGGLFDAAGRRISGGMPERSASTRDGLGMAAQTAKGTLGWASEQLTGRSVIDRGRAVKDANAHLTGTLRRTARSMSDAVADRRAPGPGQLAAHVVLTAGSALNYAAVAASRGAINPGLFVDGSPEIGEVSQLPPISAISGGLGPRRLEDLTTLIRDARAAGPAAISITGVANPGLPHRYIVALPGTVSLNPLSSGNPLDVTSLLVLLAGQHSTMAGCVMLALEAAHVPQGAPVLLTGHAQGGLAALVLRGDPTFTQAYRLTDVVTFGTPATPRAIAKAGPMAAPVLAIELSSDLLPRASRRQARRPASGSLLDQRSGTLTYARLPRPPQRRGTHLGTHSLDHYREGIWEAAKRDASLAQYVAGHELGEYFVADGGTSQTAAIPIGRRTR